MRKNVSIFLGGNSREKAGNTREKAEIPGQIHHDSKNENMNSGKFFLETVIFILKWANLQKMDRHETKICPGKIGI